eukprot:9358083-Lingulodinium_polyedra.AAC.1
MPANGGRALTADGSRARAGMGLGAVHRRPAVPPAPGAGPLGGPCSDSGCLVRRRSRWRRAPG